jgi:hypothetical protein
MEQAHEFKIVNNRSIVEQAHEFQLIVRELEQLEHVLPDKLVAGGIVAKLPSIWRNFVTALKHKDRKSPLKICWLVLMLKRMLRQRMLHQEHLKGSPTPM